MSGAHTVGVVWDELKRLFTYQERHRRLFARVLLAAGATVVVFLAGTGLVYAAESGARGGQVDGLGDAAFFTATQLLTVSSAMPNPVTTVGRFVDVGLEVWALFVVTALAGSFASFFHAGDSRP